MDTALLEQIGMTLGVGGLIAFMFFIIFDLGRRSGAGKFGTMILLLGLGVGMAGYLIKVILQYVLEN
ncbi:MULTISPECIES: DUF2788 domain-containing protein [Thalassolituus]|jgi:hypothetical protein|uniref:DUF2788 domain-containing protein n=1 Tax=Thalassolituus maritimus TaxID=484498 RepID=A0A1N7IUW0_9GAMM|nr:MULTISPECIES: DUF2788 domain-containing protein [Thalassolituus]KZY99980.1 hypothetical protein A3746_00675 [Oleibacter sp. HI0075]MAX85587.1 DUF2788 domain-containing protein [Oceanospirillaceae bacterium]MEC9255714.1 DUF2788 domain-containing protein [Pseudomonadota bacterium]KZZ08343.1 hypothetical protein A3746_29445 [Oleibacter sp. HI0075]MEC9410095.1 DUF2788 domain-containing protein [Pseudomonadota bacterium]|tara:strand:- start:517 stop:717 length:201 start_codon:yes stop_codon:yes gene_type:complete